MLAYLNKEERKVYLSVKRFEDRLAEWHKDIVNDFSFFVSKQDIISYIRLLYEKIKPIQELIHIPSPLIDNTKLIKNLLLQFGNEIKIKVNEIIKNKDCRIEALYVIDKLDKDKELNLIFNLKQTIHNIYTHFIEEYCKLNNQYKQEANTLKQNILKAEMEICKDCLQHIEKLNDTYLV